MMELSIIIMTLTIMDLHGYVVIIKANLKRSL